MQKFIEIEEPSELEPDIMLTAMLDDIIDRYKDSDSDPIDDKSIRLAVTHIYQKYGT